STTASRICTNIESPELLSPVNPQTYTDFQSSSAIDTFIKNSKLHSLFYHSFWYTYMAPNPETSSQIGSYSKSENLQKPRRLSMEGLQRTISDISLELSKETSDHHSKLPTISEVEDAKCECCGMCEECTPEYIKRVRDQFSGKLICGLCAEAVSQEMEKNGGKREEALKEHMNACVRFNRIGRAYPVLYQAEAMKEIFKKSSSIRAKSISPKDRNGGAPVVSQPSQRRLLSDFRLRKMASDVSEFVKFNETLETNFINIEEIKQEECTCCGLKEDCTVDYSSKVRNSYSGNWICGLCSEAVKERMGRGPTIAMQEAVSSHKDFCQVFNSTTRLNPKLSLTCAMRNIAKKSCETRNSKISSILKIARSRSCVPRI
ncbi:hypothetical protein Tsubulata_040549, partial [Turnera subulata]